MKRENEEMTGKSEAEIRRRESVIDKIERMDDMLSEAREAQGNFSLFQRDAGKYIKKR